MKVLRIKSFLICNELENLEQKSVFWNLLSSGFNSIISIVLLWVVTRISGTFDAGVFSIGFATAQMMLTIGNYGMRNFQATDVVGKFTLDEYKKSRIVTTLIMIGVSVVFVLLKGYYAEKAFIVLTLCFLKVTDAFDDLYGGYYQSRGRLDVGGKIWFIRIVVYVAVFTFVLIASKNLILACIFSAIASGGVLYFLIKQTKELLKCKKGKWSNVKRLLIECAPLCMGGYMIVYIGNAPKYAIDMQLSSEFQAYYTYLFMPCFMINLFVGFALQPSLVKLTSAWVQGKYDQFRKMCVKIIGLATVISFIVVVIGGVIGCEALGLFFGIDLKDYRMVLVVLLIGGVLYTFATIFQIFLTIMRHQFSTLIGFLIASIFALIVSTPLVRGLEIMGAGISYILSMGMLLAIFILLFYSFLKKSYKTNHIKRK